eukprot:704_1
MSLAKAIEFRQLIAQLTPKEKAQFASEHIDFIITTLFHQFAQQKHLKQVNELESFNQSLSQFLESRKQKPKAISPINVKLDELPTVVIGSIASFLSQVHYNRFKRSNRSLYCGCSSHNTLQQLSLNLNSNHASNNIHRGNIASYSNVKRLSLNTSTDIISLQTRIVKRLGRPVFKQIISLEIAVKQEGFLGKFVNQEMKIMNCDSVRQLAIVRFGEWLVMTKYKLMLFLEPFRNLEYLMLSNISARDIKGEDIVNACPNLIGLNMDRMHIKHLVCLLGHKLRYLSFTHFHANQWDGIDNVSFDELEELRTTGQDYQTLNSIIKSAIKLNKISLDFAWKTRRSNHIDIMRIINNVMVKCSSLNYMYLVSPHYDFGSVLEGIESGLLHTKMTQRTKLKIHVRVTANSKFTTNDFVQNVGTIVSALELSKIDHFMFIWCLHLRKNRHRICNEIYKKLSKISAHTNVVQYRQQFVITNKDCKIDGFYDRVCSHCCICIK